MKLELPADRIAVKICGITNRDDALAAVDAGADLLGFNTWPGTKRFVDIARNADWIAALPRPVVRVALLVNATPEETERIAAFPFVDALQFHGDEDADFCRWVARLGKPIIKALRARDRGVLAQAGSFSTPHILLDAHVPGEFGGTGARVDLELVREFKAAASGAHAVAGRRARACECGRSRARGVACGGGCFERRGNGAGQEGRRENARVCRGCEAGLSVIGMTASGR